MNKRSWHRRLRLGTALLVGLVQGGLMPFLEPFVQAATNDRVVITVRIDVFPPNPVPDLGAVSTPTEGQVKLDWTAPTDAPNGGPATSYQIKRSTKSVNDLLGDTTAWWNQAALIAGPPAPKSPGTYSTMTVTALEPGVTYYFALKSLDRIYSSAIDVKAATPGQQANAAPKDIAPAIPQNLAAASGDAKVTLTWNANSESDLDYYRIYRDSIPPEGPYTLYAATRATTFVDAGLTNGNTYYYRITAVDKGAPRYPGIALESGQSSTATGIPFQGAPAAPSNFKTLQISTYSIRWGWQDNATDEDGYRVKTSTGGAISGNLAADTTAYLETNLALNAPYSRYVEGFRNIQISTSSTVTRYTAARPPVSLSLGTITTTAAPLNWDQDGNPSYTTFFLERSTDAVNFTLISVAITTNTVTDASLTEGATYFYRVYAQNGDGVKTAPSNAVSGVVPRISPNPITDLAAAPGTAAGAVDLSWTAVGDDGAAGNITGGRYRIDYDTNPAAGHLLQTDVYQLDFATNTVTGQKQRRTVVGLTPGLVYYFRVYALDEGLNASLSNQASAKATRPPDTTPPQIASYSPSSSLAGVLASDVLPDVDVVVKFSEAMSTASLNSGFRLRAVRDRLGNPINQAVAGAWQFSGQTSTFRSAVTYRNNTTYEISVTSAATDEAGNTLANPVTADFVTIFDRTEENVLTGYDGKTCVRVPSDTFKENGYVRMSMDPMQVSFDGLSGFLQEANDKMKSRGGIENTLVPNSLREFKARNLAGTDMGKQLQKPVELCLPYDVPNNDGFVDLGSGQKVNERFLGVITLNEEARLWVIVPGSEVSNVDKKVKIKVPHLSAYALLPVFSNYVGGAYAFPVPFVPSKGQTKITFTNLALRTTIRVYNVSGEMVREMESTDGTGQLDWDAKNDKGQDVVSGVYIYEIKSGNEKKIGRLMIIR